MPMKKRLKGVFLGIAALLVAVWFVICLGSLSTGQTREGAQQLETALRRASVACYAAEGIYPPTASYLTKHYGIQIDDDRYCVFYEVFAENLMPEITVIEK